MMRVLVFGRRAVACLSTSAMLFAALITTACMAAENSNLYEFLSDASGEFVPIRIVDSESMPIQRRQDSTTGWGIRTLFENPEGGSPRILYVRPGVEVAKVRYRKFHEQTYKTAGDFMSPDRIGQ